MMMKVLLLNKENVSGVFREREEIEKRNEPLWVCGMATKRFGIMQLDKKQKNILNTEQRKISAGKTLRLWLARVPE